MKNGRADHDDDEPNDPKIARIEDARRRRQLGLGEKGGGGAKPKGRPSLPSGGGVKELLIGAVIVACALGFVVWMVRPLWQGAVSGGQ